MKRIVTCSDGTWNKPGDMVDGHGIQTNVQKIFEAICKKVTHPDGSETHQIKFYGEGVGTEGSFVSRAFEGATGAGIDDNIKAMYKFIVWNYEPGDELFLLGFSRGAYTARSLAGMIRNCGILKNNDLTLIDQAYQIYRDRDDPRKNPNGSEAMAFKAANCFPEEKIKFVGVWDTVGALGIPVHAFEFLDQHKYEFHDTTLSSMIENAYHALAVDEKRGNFQPTLWTQSGTVKAGDAKQVLQQRWFSGVHSNVGGGYEDTGLSDIALKWLCDSARGCGLGFDEPYLAASLKPNVKGMLYNSRTGFFALPPAYIRPVMKTADAFESVDPSVYERMATDPTYKPGNVPPKE